MPDFIATNTANFRVNADGTLTQVATNSVGSAGPDYAAYAEASRQNIGTTDGVPLSYAKHEASIVKAWPEFVTSLKARGIADPSTLWNDFVVSIFNVLERRESAAASAALQEATKKLAANSLTSDQLAICTKMGVTPDQLVNDMPSPAELLLDAGSLKMCRLMGVTPETFLATPREPLRRR